MDYLCCPSCNRNFEMNIKEALEGEVIEGVLECCECKRRFEIKEGLPNFNFPENLEESDHHEQIFYDRLAPMYDLRSRTSQLRLGNWEYFLFNTRARQPLIKGLELKQNYSVLDTGTGTGTSLSIIAKLVGEGGQLHGSDISRRMLEVAQKKMKTKGVRAELLLANASYLPYRTGVFDAVLHIGGLNTFADKKRAIKEMYRVAKPGSKIVCCDEGLRPGKEKTWFGRTALKKEPKLYSSKPPLEFVPDKIEDLKVYWIWGGLSWVIEFRKQ
jgi:ubiquinone/menaquinone biosynthesis C-methylase UbiE